MYQVCVPKDSAMPIAFFTSQGNVTTSTHNGLKKLVFKTFSTILACMFNNESQVHKTKNAYFY